MKSYIWSDRFSHVTKILMYWPYQLADRLPWRWARFLGTIIAMPFVLAMAPLWLPMVLVTILMFMWENMA